MALRTFIHEHMARGEEVRLRLIVMLTCPTSLFDKLLDMMGV